MAGYSQNLVAIPLFLQEWKTIYAESSSSDRACQLCHVRAEGGEPWNAYGFEIRDAYIELFGSTQIGLAIRAVESNNSDRDSNNQSNLEEINLNLDPGWNINNDNVWIFKNGDAIKGKPFPFVIPALNQQFCFPIKGKDSSVSLICL